MEESGHYTENLHRIHNTTHNLHPANDTLVYVHGAMDGELDYDSPSPSEDAFDAYRTKQVTKRTHSRTKRTHSSKRVPNAKPVGKTKPSRLTTRVVDPTPTPAFIYASLLVLNSVPLPPKCTKLLLAYYVYLPLRSHLSTESSSPAATRCAKKHRKRRARRREQRVTKTAQELADEAFRLAWTRKEQDRWWVEDLISSNTRLRVRAKFRESLRRQWWLDDTSASRLFMDRFPEDFTTMHTDSPRAQNSTRGRAPGPVVQAVRKDVNATLITDRPRCSIDRYLPP